MKTRQSSLRIFPILIALCLFSGRTLKAQDTKLAISKFSILEDFSSNPALFGYWGKPAFGAFYEGPLRKRTFRFHSYGAHFNSAFGNNGLGLTLYKEREHTMERSAARLGYSREIKLSPKFTLRAGGAFKYTSIKIEYHTFIFPDQIEPFYGFVRPTNEPYNSFGPTSLITGDFGLYLQSSEFLIAVNGENLLPVLLDRNEQDAEFFSSASREYLPAQIRVAFAYEFNLPYDFDLTPAASWRYNFGHPQPYPVAMINLQWRNIVMINYRYDLHGIPQLMLGGRINDKLSLSAGAATFTGEYLPGFTDRIVFNFSVLAQL